MNKTNKPILTTEQKVLTEAKETLSGALTEINEELGVVTGYLNQVGRVLQLDFINDLKHSKESFKKYLFEARDAMNSYCKTRTELVSFADREDIFFIPKLLNVSRDNIRSLLSILKKRKEEVLKYKDVASEDVIENVIYYHNFFKDYSATLEEMWKDYEDLYDKVYKCDKKEYGRRLDRQYVSLNIFSLTSERMHERLCMEIAALEELYENRVSDFLEPACVSVINTKESSIFKIKSGKVILSINKEYNLERIEREKTSVTESIRKIVPDLSEEEFINSDDLAYYIHKNKLTHNKANEILLGYYQLKSLEVIKDKLLNTEGTEARLGRKRCTCFDDLDESVLKDLYKRVFEKAKGYIYRKSVNAFAALFLTAMARMNFDVVYGITHAFYSFMKETSGILKLCYEKICDNIKKCAKFFNPKNKLDEKEQNECKQWQDVIDMITAELSPKGLFIV